MLEIRKANIKNDLEDIHKIIQQSFLTVAIEFNLTKENSPTNPAYITIERLKESFDSGIDFFVGILDGEKVACIALENDKSNTDNYFIERLAVIPEFRHNKIGKKLLEFAMLEINKKYGLSAGIAIINENIKLKEWYLDNGFTEDRIKSFEHLQFTVCFMSKSLRDR